jgi:CheY-like chemotaxis protein
MHGGTLSAQSAGLGKGATFTVRLPLLPDVPAKSPAPAAKASNPSNDKGQGLHILLVEDHPDTARMMGRLLRAEGHYVRAASDVASALKAAGQERFDLLVSDVGLPDGNGLQLMEQLCRLYKLKGIALSGYGMDGDIEKSRSAGFAAHLTKPVDFQVLLDTVGHVAAAG